MAWTVIFALLGAMTFPILIVPVLAAFFPKGVRETAQRDHEFSCGAVSPPAALSIGGWWPLSVSPPWRERFIWVLAV